MQSFALAALVLLLLRENLKLLQKENSLLEILHCQDCDEDTHISFSIASVVSLRPWCTAFNPKARPSSKKWLASKLQSQIWYAHGLHAKDWTGFCVTAEILNTDGVFPVTKKSQFDLESRASCFLQLSACRNASMMSWQLKYCFSSWLASAVPVDDSAALYCSKNAFSGKFFWYSRMESIIGKCWRAYQKQDWD